MRQPSIAKKQEALREHAAGVAELTCSWGHARAGPRVCEGGETVGHDEVGPCRGSAGPRVDECTCRRGAIAECMGCPDRAHVQEAL